MNYLAHAYLSFNKPGILVGNLISDFVKGKKQYDYPSEIQKGIKLHRAIDQFTDDHFITKQAKEFFRPGYRLYSGAFVDIVFDHFLANDVNSFSDIAELKKFSNQSYAVIAEHLDILPEKFRRIFPYMQSQDWLYNYHHKEGIEQSFYGLSRRAAYFDDTTIANDVFKKNYNELKNCFDLFFPELKKFTSYTLTKHLES